MRSESASGGVILQHIVIWRRAGLLLVVCAALAAIASSDTLHEALIELLSTAQDVISQRPLLGAMVFVVFAAASALFTFLSIAIVVPAAVYAWGEWITALLLWFGWWLGGAAAYCVGRFLGRAVVRWLTAQDALSRLEQRVQRDAPFWLVLLLQLALPSEITGYLLGLVRYRADWFLLALALAEAPYVLATIYLGSSFVAGRGLAIMSMGALVAALIAAALFAVNRVLDEQRPRARRY